LQKTLLDISVAGKDMVARRARVVPCNPGMSPVFLGLLLCLMTIGYSEAFRLLLVGPSFFASHQMQLQCIGEEMAKRGFI
jgi:hypothetical protein